MFLEIPATASHRDGWAGSYASNPVKFKALPRENRVSVLISLAVINEKEPERRLIGIDAAFAEIAAHEMQYIIPHIMFVQCLNKLPALVQKLSYNSPIYFLRMLGIPAQAAYPDTDSSCNPWFSFWEYPRVSGFVQHTLLE